MIPSMMFIAFIASLALPVLGVVATVAYIRRTRELREARLGGSFDEAVLDHLEQLQVRLDAMSARLDRIEEGLRLGNVIPPSTGEPGARRRLAPREGDR